ncbi:DUF6498-containing protein [Haladaptatus sp. W1]|uniref:DUF6498-containing protein n=1 Tax=Haladaptatus sp. W1 TaxID=1897478 RepID=UPI0020C7A8DC|nr:DUF6498-containing protein [Haladaptatus sp. W1]
MSDTLRTAEYMIDRDALRRVATVIPLLGANLFPVVGVLSFGWTPVAVLVLYWVEMGIVTCWSVPKVLFAQRRSPEVGDRHLPLSELREKRGGKSLWRGGPPAYVRNVPFAAAQVNVLLLVWFLLGALLFTQLGLQNRMTSALMRTVAVGGVGMAVGRGVEFHREYIREKNYAETSPRATQQATARHTAVFVLLMGVAGVIESARTASLVGVGVIVAAKLAHEVHNYRTEYADERPGGIIGRLLDSDGNEDPPERVSMPDGTPDERIRPDTRAVVADGIVPGVSGLASRTGYLAVLLTAFGVIVLEWVVVAAGVALLSPIVLGKLGSHYLRRGTVEYRRYGDEIVEYDRWLDEPQWRVAIDDIEESSVPRRVVDRFLGTGTIALDWRDADEERHVPSLGPFEEVTDVAEGLGLSATDAEQKDPNRTMFVAAAGIALTFLAVPVGVISSGEIGAGGVVLLTLLFGGPFLVVLGALLWVAAMNW